MNFVNLMLLKLKIKETFLKELGKQIQLGYSNKNRIDSSETKKVVWLFLLKLN